MNSNIEHLDRLKYPRTSLRSRSQVIDEIKILLADIRKSVHTGLHLGAGSSKIPGLIKRGGRLAPPPSTYCVAPN
jgi:hypothetical protein